MVENRNIIVCIFVLLVTNNLLILFYGNGPWSIVNAKATPQGLGIHQCHGPWLGIRIIID
jgi:hypothetical protein